MGAAPRHRRDPGRSRRRACSWPGSPRTRQLAVIDEAAFADRAAGTLRLRRGPRGGRLAHRPARRGRAARARRPARPLLEDAVARAWPSTPPSSGRSAPPPRACTTRCSGTPTPRRRCGRRLRRGAARGARAPAPGRGAACCRGSGTRRCSAVGSSGPERALRELGAAGAPSSPPRSRSSLGLAGLALLALGDRAQLTDRRRAVWGSGLAVAAAGGLAAAGRHGGQRPRARAVRHQLRRRGRVGRLGRLRRRPAGLGAGGVCRRPGRRRGGRRAAAGAGERCSPPRAPAARGCCARPACSPSRRSPSSARSSCCTPASSRSRPRSSTSPPATCCASWRRRTARAPRARRGRRRRAAGPDRGRCGPRPPRKAVTILTA